MILKSVKSFIKIFSFTINAFVLLSRIYVNKYAFI